MLTTQSLVLTVLAISSALGAHLQGTRSQHGLLTAAETSVASQDCSVEVAKRCASDWWNEKTAAEAARDSAVADKITAEAARDSAVADKITAEAARDSALAAPNDPSLLSLIALAAPNDPSLCVDATSWREPGTCIHGKCIKRPCDCDSGWMGDNCDESIDDCPPNACSGHGQCVDGHNSFSCACNKGPPYVSDESDWFGEKCDRVISGKVGNKIWRQTYSAGEPSNKATIAQQSTKFGNTCAVETCEAGKESQCSQPGTSTYSETCEKSYIVPCECGRLTNEEQSEDLKRNHHFDPATDLKPWDEYGKRVREKRPGFPICLADPTILQNDGSTATLIAGSNYCSNRICLGGACTESVKKATLAECASAVISNVNCGNEFSYSSYDGWCDCVPPGQSCVPAIWPNYATYKIDMYCSQTDSPYLDSSGGLDWDDGTDGNQAANWPSVPPIRHYNYKSSLLDCKNLCIQDHGADQCQAVEWRENVECRTFVRLENPLTRYYYKGNWVVSFASNFRNVGLSSWEPYPDWYPDYKETDGKQTWATNEAECKRWGKKLCTYEELCPNGKDFAPRGSTPVNLGLVFPPAGTVRNAGDQWTVLGRKVNIAGDQWVPIQSQTNGNKWIQAGTRAGGKCNPLSTYHGSSGSWMENPEERTYKKWNVCCDYKN